jgi:hypothetical protein
MSGPKPDRPPERPETPIGDPPPRPRGPYPVDRPDDPAGGADPDYLPGANQQPEVLPKR